jgi:hypothetical protein
VVPVWVDVRQQPVPEFPARDDILVGTRLDDDGRVRDLGSQGFFLRWLILDPHDATLLNPQAPTVAGSAKQLLREGAFAYAQVRPKAVRAVVEEALQAYEAHRATEQP